MLSLQAFKIDAEEMSHAQCIALNVHSLKKKKKRKNHKISHGHMIAHHNNINNNTRNSKDDTKHNTNNNNNHDNDSNHGFNNVVNMNVPPGFRFHPTDEELISFYLTNKVMVVDPMAAPSDITNFDLHRVIPEVDLNKLEPWDLYEKCKVSSASHQTATAGAAAMPATEWYFFSHKDKKYPTGTRTNRATAAGFWKATGRDKAVHSVTSRRSIGMRKTLVFYRGRAPHGTKTDWIMHEYRLEDKDYEPKCNEDGWVVCRVFKKRCLQDKEATRHSNSNMSDEESPLTYPQGKKRHKKDSDEIETTVTNNMIPIIAHLPCKLEVMEDLPPLQPAFFQLPQLQSCSEIADSTLSIPMENHNKNMVNQPPSLCSDLDPEECDEEEEDDDDDNDDDINSYSNNNKPFFMSEDELASFIYNGHFPDGWSMYDTMGRYNPELCSFPIDLPQTLYFSKVQPPPIEYPSNCDVDLWNFTR